MRRTAIVLCALLFACTTDFDRFKIGASSQPNGVTAGEGGRRGDAGGAGSESPAPRGGKGGDGAANAGSDAPSAGSNAGGSTAPPQSDGGPMAGSGPDPCEGMTVYLDGDGDGYGDPTTGRPGCEADGLVARAGDCADNDEARNPEAKESCSTEEDDNCNDAANEGCSCTPGMSQPCGTSDGKGGFLDRGQCKVGTQDCVEGKWSDECDGAVGPGLESCDMSDEDCDGRADEGFIVPRWTDGDGDLYGGTQLPNGCTGESGVAYQGGDCADDNMLIHPGAQETCGRAGQLGDDCDANTVIHCPTNLPATPAGCPTLTTGDTELFGYNVRLWVGTRNETTPAPVVIFFFGTGGSSSQATFYYPKPADIAAAGGIFIAMSETTMMGTNTSNAVWYTGDFAIIDQVLGCALAQLNLDARRIYVTGMSSGGIQAAVMGFQRSGYIAGVLTNSGGLAGTSLAVPQTPGQVPVAVAMHGKMGSDAVIIDFADASRVFTSRIVQEGGFAVDCDHGGGHALAPAAMQQGGWKVLLDHPYGEPAPDYALPSELTSADPPQCRIVLPP